MNWKLWIHLTIAAFIGGAANTVTVMIVDPQAFNLNDLKKLGTVALLSGVVSVAMFLKKAPLPDAPADVSKVGLLIFLPFALMLSGCAVGGGAFVRRDITTTTGTNTVRTVEKARVHPFIAFGDAVQQVGKMKAGNTKTGNSIGVTGFDQETSATNIAPIIKSGAEGFGVAFRAFMGVP